MGASTLMSIGTRAMAASFAALQTTGNNIANANTQGYSRQSVELATAGGQYSGAGFFGKGVDIVTVSRSYDRFLTLQAASSASIAASDRTRASQIKQLEGVLTLGTTGIGHAAGQMLNAFVDVANTPQDASARQVVITRAQELAGRFSVAGDQFSSLQTGVTLDLKSAVDTVNGLADQMVQLNRQISALQGSAHLPNDLLDQRDLVVAEIGKYVNVTSVTADDDSVGLFVGGGQALVLGATVNRLKAVNDSFDPSKVQLVVGDGVGELVIAQSALSGGSIHGLLKFQNDDLAHARNLIGQMAVAISGAVNEQQSLGLNLGQPPAFGSPLFAVGSPKALQSTLNTGDGVVSLTVNDYTHVQASDYELHFDGTNYTVTRLYDQQAADGNPYTAADLSAGINVDGLTIQLSSGTVQAGDRFLLAAVSPAAQDMRSVLSESTGVAAASPVVATFNVNNTGSASVASLAAVDSTLDRTLTANITFTSATGDYDWSLVDASGGVTSSGTGIWTASSAIALNGFELVLDGVPQDGDELSVSPTRSVLGNNGNALALSRLGSVAFVGVTTLPDGSQVSGRTITDAYASAVSDIGVRVQSATSSAAISTTFADAAESARANKAGVNLDEEAARLIQYQQSYQASAKVLQIAQTVFDTLIQVAGR